MRIEQLRMAVDLCYHAKITPFIWGGHGTGKSQTIKDLCFLNDWGFVDERLSQSEAADLRGLPAKDEVRKKTIYYAPAQFPTGDLTMEAICQLLATELGVKVPAETIGILSPLKQLRLMAKAGRLAVVKGDKITFDGDKIPYERLRTFEIALTELMPRFPEGIIFYDEFNRAEDDVLQCSFEVVYDRRIGMHVIPPLWGVVAAGNYTEGYMTNPAVKDPALMDRFCHLELTTGPEQLDDWASYLAQTYGEDAQQIIEFGLQNTEHVYGKGGAVSDLAIQPSPRSWEMVAKIVRAAREGQYSDLTIQDCISGLVGAGLAQKYMKYVCPIKPREIVERGIASQRSALEAVAKQKHARGIMGGLMFGVLSFAQDRMNEPKVINNLFDFAEFMAKTDTLRDLAVAFMRPILGAKTDGKDKQQDGARAALISNTRLAALVSMYKPEAGQTRAIDEMNKRPDLKALMQNVAWGEE